MAKITALKNENKTNPTNQDVEEFINQIEDFQTKADCQKLSQIMFKISGLEPKMWGESIIGFGVYHYRYASGREGDWFRVGFSPRKQNLTIYIILGFKQIDDLMADLSYDDKNKNHDNKKNHKSQKIGYKTSASCLYIKKLSDIKLEVLEKIITWNWDQMLHKYPQNTL